MTHNELVVGYPWCAYHQGLCKEISASYHRYETMALTFEPVRWLESMLSQPRNQRLVEGATVDDVVHIRAMMEKEFPDISNEALSGRKLTEAVYSLKNAKNDRRASLEECFNWDAKTQMQNDMTESQHCTQQTRSHVFQLALIDTMWRIFAYYPQMWQQARRDRKAAHAQHQVDVPGRLSNRRTVNRDDQMEAEEDRPLRTPSPDSSDEAIEPPAMISPCLGVNDITTAQVCGILGEMKIGSEKSNNALLLELAKVPVPKGTLAVLGIRPTATVLTVSNARVVPLLEDKPLGKWNLLISKARAKPTSRSCLMPVSLRISILEAAMTVREGPVRRFDVRSPESEDRFWMLLVIAHNIYAKRWMRDGSVPTAAELSALLFVWNLVANTPSMRRRVQVYADLFAAADDKAATRDSKGFKKISTLKKVSLLGTFDEFVRAVKQQEDVVDVARVGAIKKELDEFLDWYDTFAALSKCVEGGPENNLPLTMRLATTIFLANVVVATWLAQSSESAFALLNHLATKLRASCGE